MDDLREISEKFDDVKNIRSKIYTSFSEISSKIASLKVIYKDISEKHTQMECNLGVDSLYFQNELITREFNNLKLLLDFINNRIYCEYYKLNSMIQSYIKNDLRSPELIKKTKMETVYPPYKSLEPLKVYDFSLVIQLFNQIVDLLGKMHSHTKNQDENLLVDQGRLKMGLNIDNVIHSQTYINTILREKGSMFKSYLHAFQRHHIKYLTRLEAKVDLVLSIIHDDISIGSSKNTSNNSHTNKEPPNKEPPNKEPPNKEPPNKEPPNKEPPNKEPPNKEPPNKEPPNKEPPNKEPPNKEPPNKEPPNKEPPNKEPPNKEPPKESDIAHQIVKDVLNDVVNKMENDNIKVIISDNK